MNRWRVCLCAGALLWVGAGCSASSQQRPNNSYANSYDSYDIGGRSEESYDYAEAESMNYDVQPASAPAPSRRSASSSGVARRSAPTPRPAPKAAAPGTPVRGGGAPDTSANGGQAATSGAAPKGEESAKTAPLLIYNGTVLLALYDVADTQEKIIELVESEGGWVSTRSTNRVILRVPAPKFRVMLDRIAGMGDLLDLQWQAEDVTAVVRDTRIRLDSALAMRARLQELLAKASDVKDALAIEQQLGRVILEIEQLQAALRGYKDRIAYSTITVEFRPKANQTLPNTEYTLPFSWIDGLGVQRLLQIPRM
ncbi:uncharacterized protein DUF4349 [Bradymonas sediminis]|uniref:DUF4349 domain-containing protein n=2 Tax=Bradymonas sediminis TaxID=1548548 RepID=A0A2Z4FIE4_9DELT|nr:hypothetical protein DN745_04625 [Bradymonas sediminis]TDP63655.1 uncharacterized protein DUF4349 [Bradymonas sediminis]